MLEMCLRTLELFSVFIGFIFMFLYLYKHTSHYPPRKRSDRTLQNVARAFTAIRRTIHKHRTLLVCVELFLEEQGCTVQGTRSLLYSAVRRASQQASRSTLAAVSVVVFCLLIGAALANPCQPCPINHIFQALPVGFSPLHRPKGKISTLIHRLTAAYAAKTSL